MLEALVELETQLGHDAQLELFRELGAQIPGRAGQAGERALLLLRDADHADTDPGVAQVARHPDTRDGHESDARITDLARQECRDRVADFLRDTLGAVVFLSHGLQITGHGIDDAGARCGRHQIVRGTQHALSILAVARNDADGDLGALPRVLKIGFGDRNVELMPQAVFDAAQHVALILERLTAVEMQLPDD